MNARLALLGLVSALLGCSLPHTHVPDEGQGTIGYYDPSTPPQYGSAFDSGYLGYRQSGNLVYIKVTRNRAKGEAQATKYTDRWGNHIFLLPGDVPIKEFDATEAAKKAKLEAALK